MTTDERTYEEGLIEGRILGIEETIAKHGGMLESHDIRIRSQERIQWAIIGAVTLMQILPTIRDFAG